MTIPTNDEIATAAVAVNKAPEEGTAILRVAWGSMELTREAERIAEYQAGQHAGPLDAAILSAMALGLNVGLRIREARARQGAAS